MPEWSKYIQTIVAQIDCCIKTQEDENMTLSALSKKLGYSEYYTSRMFCNILGMTRISQKFISFYILETMKVSDTGIFGRSRYIFRGGIVRLFAAY